MSKLTGLLSPGFQKGQPIRAEPFNELQRHVVTSITVQQGTPLTCFRTGNNVVIGWRGAPPGGIGVDVRFGKATAAWTSGNTVTLTPCKSITDGTATGEDNISCYIVTPTGASPTGLSIATNDILAYIPIGKVGGTPRGHIVNVKQAGGSIPSGTGKYKVLQLVDTGDPGTAAWDYPRFH